MERLLQEEGDMARSPPCFGAGDFNGNPPEDGDQELLNTITAETDQDNSQMAVDNEDEDDDEEDEDEEYSNGSPGDEEAGELLSNGVGEEHPNNNKQLNEEWHSGRREGHRGTTVYFIVSV